MAKGFHSTDIASKSQVNIGTPETNVNATEYGDGTNHRTVLTLTDVLLPGPAGSGNEAKAFKLYEFPAGVHAHRITDMEIALNGGGIINADTPDIGIGSTNANGAVATLDGTSTFEDYITGQTAPDCNNTPLRKMTGATAGYGTGISLNEMGDAKDVFLNYADNWAGADTLRATGTIIIEWTTIE